VLGRPAIFNPFADPFLYLIKMVLRTKIESTQKPYDAFTTEGLAADASDGEEDTERKSDDESEDNVPTYTAKEVKERGGKVLRDRFTLNPKGRLKVGQSIYKALVKKMLNVHIAHIERKMRACQRCPPRCNTGLPRVKHPYTTPHEGEDFVPRSHLPGWLQKYLGSKGPLSQQKEKKIRRGAEKLEDDIENAGGDVAKVDGDRLLKAVLKLIGGKGKPPNSGEIDEKSDTEESSIAPNPSDITSHTAHTTVPSVPSFPSLHTTPDPTVTTVPTEVTNPSDITSHTAHTTPIPSEDSTIIYSVDSRDEAEEGTLLFRSAELLALDNHVWHGHEVNGREEWADMVLNFENNLAFNGPDDQVGSGAPVAVWRNFAQAIIAANVENNARPLELPSDSDEQDEKNPLPAEIQVAVPSAAYSEIIRRRLAIITNTEPAPSAAWVAEARRLHPVGSYRIWVVPAHRRAQGVAALLKVAILDVGRGRLGPQSDRGVAYRRRILLRL